ncbi:MAG TPA: Hsp20/alpha crystallin family protein [Vicinamibacteria bacterium]|nr:Hsp20/alpha crystallin family protein [Vicinamibacteria bacterium]
MTMSRWDPFNEALSLRQALGQLMEEAVVHPGRGPEGRGGGGRLSFPVDVFEREDAVVVRAALPGVRPEDVDITFEESVLTIEGELAEDEPARTGAQPTAAPQARGQTQPANGQQGEAAPRAPRPGGGRYHQRERAFGPFIRQVRLPMLVNAEQAAATFEHGLLTITLPKAEQARRRTITVRSQGSREAVPVAEHGTPAREQEQGRQSETKPTRR